MYTRASASDYDDFQAKGWTTKELIPLMKKHETYQVRFPGLGVMHVRTYSELSGPATTVTFMALKAQSRSHLAIIHTPSKRTSCVLLNPKGSLPRMTFKTWLPVMALSTG